MIVESTAANLALDIDQILLCRFMSFHMLIYASIVLLLGMSAESTTANLALAIPYVFLFRSLSFGVKANGWCRDLVMMIIEFFMGMLAKQTVANFARVFSYLLL
jgi:hypothetical protein